MLSALRFHFQLFGIEGELGFGLRLGLRLGLRAARLRHLELDYVLGFFEGFGGFEGDHTLALAAGVCVEEDLHLIRGPISAAADVCTYFQPIRCINITIIFDAIGYVAAEREIYFLSMRTHIQLLGLEGEGGLLGFWFSATQLYHLELDFALSRFEGDHALT